MLTKLRLGGHPVHAMLAHFPVSLLSISLLSDLLGIWRGELFWWQLSFWNITLGLLISVPAMITGFIDYVAIPNKHRAVEVATRHLFIITIAVCSFIGSLVARGGPSAPPAARIYIILLLSFLGLILLFAGGWLGGELVFRYRIGCDDTTEDNIKDEDKYKKMEI